MIVATTNINQLGLLQPVETFALWMRKFRVKF